MQCHEYAMKFIGTPYKFGGSSPMEGFDCSGLVVEVLKAFGKVPYSFDATAQGLYDKYKHVRAEDKRVMILACYGKDATKITHVGINIPGTPFMIESGGGDSSTKTIEDAILESAFVRMRPCDYRKDFIKFVYVPA